MQEIESLLSSIKQKRLLVVFPHPDDETVMAAGLLLAARELGWETRVVCLTGGSAGKVHCNGMGKSLVEIRQEELKKACVWLQVDRLDAQRFGDGKLRERKAWKVYVRQVLDEYKPGVVVTYDHSGISGHPDHIALSLHVFRIVSRMRKPPVLLWPAFTGLRRKRLVNQLVEAESQQPSLKLSLRLGHVWRKYKALKAHASQGLGKKLPIPLWLVMVLFGREETFTRADLKKEYTWKWVEFEI